MMDKQLALTSFTHCARQVVCALDEIPQALGALEELPAARSNFDSKAHVTVEGRLNRLHLRLTPVRLAGRHVLRLRDHTT
jgi:hypothetical protein